MKLALVVAMVAGMAANQPWQAWNKLNGAITTISPEITAPDHLIVVQCDSPWDCWTYVEYPGGGFFMPWLTVPIPKELQ